MSTSRLLKESVGELEELLETVRDLKNWKAQMCPSGEIAATALPLECRGVPVFTEAVRGAKVETGVYLGNDGHVIYDDARKRFIYGVVTSTSAGSSGTVSGMSYKYYTSHHSLAAYGKIDAQGAAPVEGKLYAFVGKASALTQLWHNNNFVTIGKYSNT